MSYQVFPTAATRAIPAGVGGIVAQVPNASLILTPQAPSIKKVYATTFSADENPYSNGGVWTPPATGWQGFKTISGKAQARNVNNDYDDSCAFLSGFSANHQAEADIFYQSGYTPQDGHEVEIHLRMQKPTGTTMLGIECLLGYSVSGGGWYTQIMKWNGTVGQSSPNYFSEITTTKFSITTPATGDILRARVNGTTVNVYLVRSGVESEIARATSIDVLTGNPGLGFFMRPGGTSANYSATGYRATDL